MIIEDTGSVFPAPTAWCSFRSPAASARRSRRRISTACSARSLRRSAASAPSDVVVSFVENVDEDWSFGLGRAQFLTGDL
jgi:hypothetical protein